MGSDRRVSRQNMITKPVAILGAGPAGTAAAISLAGVGIESVVIERQSVQQDQPGESLPPGAEAIFKQLGVDQALNQTDVIRHPGIEIVRHGESTLERFGEDADSQWLGYQIPRPLLNDVLQSHALKQGVKIRRGVTAHSIETVEDGYQLITDHGEIVASFVLDATGGSGWFARQQNIGYAAHSRKLIVRYGYASAHDDKTFSNPRFIEDENGWTWIAKVSSSRIAWVRMNGSGVDPGAKYWPCALDGHAKLDRNRGADVTWRLADQLAGERWFLLGDAAATTDPSASHGVLRSLMTGIKAGWLIAAAERGAAEPKEIANVYDTWLRDWFHKDRQAMRKRYPSVFDTRPAKHGVADRNDDPARRFQNRLQTPFIR